ncbi:hypothetical protein OPT61_g2768 [Boeremia exigua]|uniref:Uncharacterized protein n=1 Tax=Boeremia exigua TaxID=749465 RepID=A0ACC2IKI5_9PLEO|nr:hypothetical protein OPT61_g2768 [Boeremia exigua]
MEHADAGTLELSLHAASPAPAAAAAAHEKKHSTQRTTTRSTDVTVLQHLRRATQRRKERLGLALPAPRHEPCHTSLCSASATCASVVVALASTDRSRRSVAGPRTETATALGTPPWILQHPRSTPDPKTRGSLQRAFSCSFTPSFPSPRSSFGPLDTPSFLISALLSSGFHPTVPTRPLAPGAHGPPRLPPKLHLPGSAPLHQGRASLSQRCWCPKLCGVASTSLRNKTPQISNNISACPLTSPSPPPCLRRTLAHVLQYPGTYEIPLRTMYTLNCVPRAQPLPKDLSRGHTPSNSAGAPSPTTGQVAWNGTESATMNFTSELMTHLNKLPLQPSSLPPTFIVNFVSRCFHPDLNLVDFSQALTALDYLRDLENRRRKEMVAAFERLHIHPDSFESDLGHMAETFPGIALWVRNAETKNKKAENYYAQVWMSIRRWIMIHELSNQPFNKLNCMGMLNTLLPPMPDSTRLPSPALEHEALKEERDTFFEYIHSVQKNGPGVLDSIISYNAGPGEESGWPAVQRVVDKYLRVSKNMIDDCLSTLGPESFKAYAEERKGKKTDSGVSFGSERSSSIGHNAHEYAEEPKPSYNATSKGASKLERITREFKRMRVKPRPSVEEIVQVNSRSDTDYVPQATEPKSNRLMKARSFASLKFGNGSSLSLVSRKGSDASEAFDPEQMKKARAMYDASINKH